MLIFLTSGALQDLKTGKIPNCLILLGAAAFGIAGFIRGPSLGYGAWEICLGLALFLLRIILTAGILFPLFLFRMMGAGDIKVMAVITGYMGLYIGFEIIFYGLAAAAAWSLFYMLRKRILMERIRYFLNYFKNLYQTERILPYCAFAGDRLQAGFCFAPFLWCGFCLWLTVGGGAV